MLEVKGDNLNEKYNQLRTNTSNVLCAGTQNFAPAITDMDLITQAQEIIKKLNDSKGKELTEKEKELLRDFSKAALIMSETENDYSLSHDERYEKRVKGIREIYNKIEKI